MICVQKFCDNTFKDGKAQESRRLSRPLSLQFPLGLLVVFSSVDAVLFNRVSILRNAKSFIKTNLVVVDKVDPRKNVDEELRVPGVTGSNTLKVVGDLGLSVQGLTLLDLADHLAHIHLDFPRVLGESIETSCSWISSWTGAKGPANILQDRW